MLLARPVHPAAPAEGLDRGLALRRLGIEPAKREGLAKALGVVGVLVTGLEVEDAAVLLAGGAAHGVAVVPGEGTALLSGSRRGLEALSSALGALRAPLAQALDRALQVDVAPAPLTLGSRTFEFGERVYLMGIVNVTPDSFSDGGRFFGVVDAVAQGTALERAGADLLDVGGESTRPGAEEVSAKEEIRRVVPVIEALRERTALPISIDTRKAEVAHAACAAGATLVNDVSGFRHDPELPRAAAEAGASVCAMHMRGTPETMQKAEALHYEDLVEEVLEALAWSVEQAVAAGVPRARVVVDPGIGFAKTFGHNHLLLRRAQDLRLLGLPVLVGHSRKAFLGALAGGKPAGERVGATAAAAAVLTATGGADFLRVHDVAEVREAVDVALALRCANEAGARFKR